MGAVRQENTNELPEYDMPSNDRPSNESTVRQHHGSQAAWVYPAELSAPWKVMLTVFVLIIGLGYGGAVLNVVAQNELNDGKAGLTADDLVAHYHGYFVTPEPGEAPPSRMLQMVNGEMRPNFEDDASYEIVRDWLNAGAAKASLRDGDPSPAEILQRDCLLCHAQDSGEKIADTAAFGPTEDDADYAMMNPFLTVDVPEGEPVWQPPVGWRALALTTHAHLLSVFRSSFPIVAG